MLTPEMIRFASNLYKTEKNAARIAMQLNLKFETDFPSSFIAEMINVGVIGKVPNLKSRAKPAAWTHEMTERLKELESDGLNIREIVRELNSEFRSREFTQGAVSGKLHKMGLRVRARKK